MKKPLQERAADYANRAQHNFGRNVWRKNQNLDDAFSWGLSTGLLHGYMAGFKASARVKRTGSKYSGAL